MDGTTCESNLAFRCGKLLGERFDDPTLQGLQCAAVTEATALLTLENQPVVSPWQGRQHLVEVWVHRQGATAFALDTSLVARLLSPGTSPFIGQPNRA